MNGAHQAALAAVSTLRANHDTGTRDPAALGNLIAELEAARRIHGAAVVDQVMEDIEANDPQFAGLMAAARQQAAGHAGNGNGSTTGGSSGNGSSQSTTANAGGAASQRATPANIFSAWSLRDLNDAFTPRAPIVYVLYAILSLPSLTILYGAPGSMKSLLLAYLLMCIAGGISALPPLPKGGAPASGGIATRQARVLWVDCDNGARRTDDRFEALAKGMGLPITTPIKYVSMPFPALDLSKRQHAIDFTALLLREGMSVVAIDNLSTISGGIDQNSSDMVTVMTNLRYVAENSNAAIVIIHHERKANGFKGRRGETLRGHSSIEQFLDLSLLVERDGGSDTVSVTGEKVRGADVAPFGARFAYTHKPGTKELEEATFWGETAASPSSIQSNIESVIVAILQAQGPLTQSALLAEVKLQQPKASKNWTLGILVKMQSSGVIQGKRGQHNALYYSV